MSLQAVPVGKDVPNNVNVIIEILDSVARYNALPEKPDFW